MFFTKASLVFVVVTLAAFFCAQPVEAARGPKISNKIFFDIKHGDQELGRSTFAYLWYLPTSFVDLPLQSHWASLVVYVVSY
jgi:hypothetical protein